MMHERAEKIISLLKKNYPKVKIALNYKNPFQLLAAVILSAQCTDERVNKVTPPLFERYKDIKSFASADLKELESLIKPTGFYRNKALFIKKSAEKIITDYEGKVPSTMQALTSLPGAARKTANVVLFNAFGLNEGIAVDTHVKRLSQRLGLSDQQNPDKIEQDLIKKVKREYWGEITLLLMSHGRAVCRAKSPKCSGCFLNKLCPSSDITKTYSAM